MPTIEARIATDTPARYLRQFCRHAAAMGERRARGLPPHKGAATGPPGATGLPGGPGGMRVHVEASETTGTVAFDPLGRCVIHVGDMSLVVRVEAVDDAVMQRIRDIVTRDFDRFSRNKLVIDWHEVDDVDQAEAAR